jgi:hypothetical protein
MKKLLSAMAICVTVTLLVMPLAYGQDKAAPEKVFQGQLTKVDEGAKMISVKGAGDMEMTFALTDATQVIGSERDIQGLAGKTGSELKVTYRDAAGKHTASKIEIVERR